MKNHELEDFYHINARKLARLKKAKIDVMNPYAVRAKILGQNRRPPKWSNGCPFTDEDADAFLMKLGKHPAMRVDQNDPPTSDTEESLLERARRTETYDDARFCMTKAKALKEARQLQIMEDEYVNIQEVEADFSKLGYALRAAITRMANDLAPALAGLDEVGCARKIKESGRELMMLIADETSELYQGAEKSS